MSSWYERNKEEAYRRSRANALANPERTKSYAKKSYHKRKNDPKNIKHYLLKHAKARAVTKELPFTIIEDDIVLPDVCPVFNRPFSRDSRRLGYSLDRIIPELGYVPGNIQVISQLANAMKWDSTPEERIAFAKWILSQEKEDGPC